MSVCARVQVCVRVWVVGRVGVCMRASARVALLIPHAKRVFHIVASFVAPLAPPYFLDIIS